MNEITNETVPLAPIVYQKFVANDTHLPGVVLLGSAAIHMNQKLVWNAPNMKFTNCPEGTEFVKTPYGKEFAL